MSGYNISVEDVLDGISTENHKLVFSWYDYTLFLIMLMFSVFIGIYFGCFGQRQATAVEYLLGGKKMKVIPVSISILASATSGIALLAVPVDVYRFGTTYLYSCISVSVASILIHYIYLPVFYKLQLTSTYEYLKIRFNTKIRLMASLLFTIRCLLYLPIVMYIPALAFSQVTDLNIHLITSFIAGVCIFYTTIGGFKAVVWTDTLQFSVMFCAILSVFYLGVRNTGGLIDIWKANLDSGRLDVDFDINPLKRDTFWAAVIGLSFQWIAYVGVAQDSVQKFLSVPKLSDAKKTLLFYTIGTVLIKLYGVWTGLIMYAKYQDCDPITSGKVEKPDQLLPYFVMDVASHIPGLSGLFIAGVFCAGLSTLSAVINCLSGTIYEDFLSNRVPKDITQKGVSNILKSIVVVGGIAVTVMILLVERLGSLLQLSISFGGISSGPLLGLFTLGMICPKANSKGAMAGGLVSLSLLSWMVIGSQYYQSRGLITYSLKPVTNCNTSFNLNVDRNIVVQQPEVFFLYRITYYYYVAIGTLTVLVVGSMVSFLTKSNDPPVHKDLISPFMQWTLHKNVDKSDSTRYGLDTVMKDVEKLDKLINT